MRIRNNDILRLMLVFFLFDLKNYTKMGFTKIRAPDHVFELIKNFWDLNKDRAKPERWPTGNIYTNHWAVSCFSPSSVHGRVSPHCCSFDIESYLQ